MLAYLVNRSFLGWGDINL